MSEKSIPLNENAVLTIKGEDSTTLEHHTYKVDELMRAIIDEIYDDEIKIWFGKGVDCEVLSPHKSWQKGKVKVSLEFTPDQESSPSPLDEVRKNFQ